MNLPVSLMNSLTDIKGFSKEAFEQVHTSGEQITSVRMNPLKLKDVSAFQISNNQFQISPVPWSSHGYYLASRPSFTFDPLFHAGTYYVQEASSMFVEQALKQTIDLSKQINVLDLCAAPGGKSTLIQSLISDSSLLVSNEVIQSRASVVVENISKWGAANVVISNNDPKDFARLENFFDVIVADAPCSGSGLFRKDPDAVNEWSDNNVALCSQRQQRILADVFPALKKDGILIYSTCSYSAEEDEDILDWMVNELDVESLQLKVEGHWNIDETISQQGAYGYRFWPYKVKGEGFFIAVLKKKDGDEDYYFKQKKSTVEKLTKAEEEIVRQWIDKDAALQFVKHKDDALVMPQTLLDQLQVLQSALYIQKAGIKIGQFAKNDLIPDHEFALSSLPAQTIPAVELNDDDAIRYLRKEDIIIDSVKGWTLMQYKSHNLGWAKVLPNRVNNYYPKEWRIRNRPPSDFPR
jgi:16S rRNA C967 or C1407 C5-methylase (RsmB/RsmF family)/NOL1/NOP2/fmu family ribosome biogenesis protein